jgi:hypothetical protein
MCVDCLPDDPCRAGSARYCPVCGEPCHRPAGLIGGRVCIAGHKFTFAEALDKATRDRLFRPESAEGG